MMVINEHTPLLRKSKTPLPKFQLGLVLLFMFAEPLSSQYIYPFINQVSLHGSSLVNVLHAVDS